MNFRSICIGDGRAYNEASMHHGFMEVDGSAKSGPKSFGPIFSRVSDPNSACFGPKSCSFRPHISCFSVPNCHVVELLDLL
jgi:hypothetical protein